jgi:hypothetical protein
VDEAKATEIRKLIFTEVRQAFESFLGELSKAVTQAPDTKQSARATRLASNENCCNGCD